MDAAALGTELRRLAGATTTLAAIAALLRQREQPGSAGPMHQALRHIADTALPAPIDALTDEQAAAVLRFATVQICDAYDLLQSAARDPGWAFQDKLMLQAQGDMSRAFPHHFAAMAVDRPEFADALRGRFLDIGVGVASLALEAAARFPGLDVVGLDIWEPSLALARTHVAASPYADRVAIRAQSVTELDDPVGFTIIWFPILFFPRDVVRAAIPRIAAALRQGGWLIIPRFNPPPDGLPGALGALQMLRQGGTRWSDDQISDLLGASGLGAVESCDGPDMMPLPKLRLLLARKPAA